MANYKRNEKTKWIAVGVAIVLLACVCITAIVSGWFIKSENTKVENPSGGMEIGDVETNGISLLSARIAAENYDEYGISPQAENAYTLTATITPAAASNKEVDWTIAFKNANSTWATGKTVTDYVTVTPSADGSLTAVVENKAAFGEQIVIKCTSRDNSAISATCTVEYLQRTEYTFDLSGTEYSSLGTKTNSVTPTFSEGQYASVWFGANKSTVYTRENTDTATSYTIKPTAEFKTAITNAGFAASNLKEHSGVSGINVPLDGFFDKSWGEALYSNNTEKNKLIDTLVNFSGNAYEINLYGPESDSPVETFYITLDTSVIETQHYTPVESIALDQSEIEF